MSCYRGSFGNSILLCEFSILKAHLQKAKYNEEKEDPEKLPVSSSYTQPSVLLCMDLQNQDASYAEKAIEELERQQIMALFMKVMTKFHKYLASVDLKPHSISVDEDLDDAAKKVK
ncbi:RNA cytidine acetyltransferase 1-like protein, partial [Tanacetum coccineum]